MADYYNEIDDYAATWLRNLIAAGHIAAGVVDTRSIEDVHPIDLREFVQCHFFAGIGGWPLALRAAGWPVDRPVWSGSCPCQPFSAAGASAGFADQRHLWPHFEYLIGQHQEWCRQQKRRAPVILGEQVASKDADPWIDLVHADLEAMGYAFAAIPFPSASVGAPHIRDRNYWVAYPDGGAGGKGRPDVRGGAAGSDAQSRPGSGGICLSGGMGHANHTGLEGHAGHGGAAGRQGPKRPVAAAGVSVRLADTDIEIQGRGRVQVPGEGAGAGAGTACERPAGLCETDGEQPGATNGLWRDADWLFCRDAKWRPVEAGTFPLADGLPRGVGSGGAVLERLAGMAGLDNASLARAKSYRVGALRGYGNAINPEQARQFIEAVMECRP